jgi:ParB family chromosome partitioning protein
MQTQQITNVALNLLRPSPRNVRKEVPKEKDLRELAASIAAEGLLQGLVVTEHKNGRGIHYEVEAGQRRLAAMNLLVDDGKLKKTAAIPVTIIPIEQATSASLAENTARKDMCAADQLVAFQAMVNEGKSVEDIAARFGVTPKVVERRLKLANCAPFLIEELRAERLSLDVLMAFAITDDHEAQRAVWKGLSEWQRNNPNVIRQLLTKDEISTKTDRLAKFVGLKAYEKAGGPVRRDLFSESGESYLQDVALVQTLATEKLTKVAEEIKAAEGWAWSLVTLSLDQAEFSRYGEVSPTKRAATKQEAKHLKKLETEYRNLCDKDELSDTQEDRRVELHELIEQAEEALLEFGPKQKAKAGVIVTISHSGALEIRKGQVRPEDMKEAKKAKKKVKGGKTAGGEAVERDYSADLTRGLSSYFTSALQAQVATKPHVALALVVHSLIGDGRLSGGQLTKLRVETARLQTNAPDIEEGGAAKALAEASDAVTRGVPEEGALAFLLELPSERLLEWLAVLVAPGIDAVTSGAELDGDAQVAARAAGLNISDWWKPTAENFFKRVNKEQLAAAAKEGMPEAEAKEVANLPRKGEMVAKVEAALKDSTWVPPFLRL